MPILNQEVHNRVLSSLDSEGSERYLWAQDTYPNLKGAVEILVTWLNEAFAENKLTPESLRELTRVGVWQTNAYSRVSFDDSVVGDELWTLLAVYPEIETSSKQAASSTTNKAESKFRPDVTFVRSKKDAKRLTFEEWNQNSDNVFMQGNTILQGSIKEYAYLDFADYTSQRYVKPTDKKEITIRPDVPSQLIAMAYLKYPVVSNQIGGSLDFPKSLTDLIVEIVLNKISIKQGAGGQNLFGITDRNINRLVSLIK